MKKLIFGICILILAGCCDIEKKIKMELEEHATIYHGSKDTIYVHDTIIVEDIEKPFGIQFLKFYVIMESGKSSKNALVGIYTNNNITKIPAFIVELDTNFHNRDAFFAKIVVEGQKIKFLDIMINNPSYVGHLDFSTINEKLGDHIIDLHPHYHNNEGSGQHKRGHIQFESLDTNGDAIFSLKNATGKYYSDDENFNTSEFTTGSEIGVFYVIEKKDGKDYLLLLTESHFPHQPN